MGKWDGMTIGYWSTTAILGIAVFCFLADAGGFWLALILFSLLFLPLTYFLFIPFAVVGGILGGLIGWLARRLRRAPSCYES